MLVGRCYWKLSGRKLHRKIKTSQTPTVAKRSGGNCGFSPNSDSFISNVFSATLH
jgi:hypothetical protein